MALKFFILYDAPGRRECRNIKVTNLFHDILGKRDFILINNKILMHKPDIFLIGKIGNDFLVPHFLPHDFMPLFQDQGGIATPVKIHVCKGNINQITLQYLPHTRVDHLAQPHKTLFFRVLFNLQDFPTISV